MKAMEASVIQSEDQLREEYNALLRQGSKIKLQVGCGEHPIPGWLNTDKEALDITKPFPFVQSSLDAIFAEHVIEHLAAYQAYAFFEECRRCLRPGGYLRIAYPDILNMTKAKHTIAPGYELKWAYGYGMDWHKNVIAGHGHVVPWTSDVLVNILDHLGFFWIGETSPRCASMLEYEDLEQHHNDIGTYMNQVETTVQEFSRRRPLSEEKMPCAIITKARPWSYLELEEMGYKYTPYFYSDREPEGYVSATPLDLGHTYLLGKRAKSLTPFEQSLRKNWIAMLEDAPYDVSLFLEADAVPVVEQWQLRYVVDKLIRQYPDADIIKLFEDLRFADTNSPDPTDRFSDLGGKWKPQAGKATHNFTVWGSHAYIVRNREKLINILKTIALPTDTAVEHAAANDMLNVVVTKGNYFYQKPHPSTHQFING